MKQNSVTALSASEKIKTHETQLFRLESSATDRSQEIAECQRLCFKIFTTKNIFTRCVLLWLIDTISRLIKSTTRYVITVSLSPSSISIRPRIQVAVWQPVDQRGESQIGTSHPLVFYPRRYKLETPFARPSCRNKKQFRHLRVRCPN